MKKLALFLAFLALITSCGVQKRKYQKGYYVNWNRSGSQNQKHTVTERNQKPNTVESPSVTINERVSPQSDLEELYASAGSSTDYKGLKHPHPTIKDEPCDEMFFNDGSDLKVKVIEITADEVKYHKCDMPDGPLYVAKKSNVFLIKYSNGTREIFSKPANQTPSNAQSSKKSNYTGPKKTHPMAVASLVMGILSIIPYVTILTAILAIVFGNIALRQIKADPDRYKGEGLAKGGKTIGIVFLSLIGLALLFLLLLILIFI